MKSVLLILSLLLFSSSVSFAQEKKVKVDGVIYVVDVNNGTACVGTNYRGKLFNSNELVGTVKGDIILASSIQYQKKVYPVTSISTNAFLGCDQLHSITIPASVSKLGINAFACIYHLNQILVAPENPYFQSIDGVLFSKDMSRIYRFPSGRSETTYTIPSTVISIEDGAFRSSNLKEIKLSENIRYIKSNAFIYCKFETITIPTWVMEIGNSAFEWCSNITSVKLPISVFKVGSNAFKYCNNLTSVIYQNKYLSFPPDAFEKCDKLTSDKIIYEVPTNLFLELAQKGNPEAQYRLGMCYMEGEGFQKDLNTAIKWFEKAATTGHKLSQKTLGDIYLNGLGVEKNPNEAIKWYTLAAKNGNVSSQKILGDLYFYGKGVKQNSLTAINYYKLAADQDDNESEAALGNCYYFGYGVDKDYNEAVKWFTLSANKDNAEAAYYLAICYNEGKGLEKNNTEALKWSEKAVNGGIEKAQRLYCILAYNDAVNRMNSAYYSSAVSEFTSLLRYDKDNVDAYINRGYCYMNLRIKDYTSAKADFDKALELDKNNKIASDNLQIIDAYFQRIKDANDLCNTAYQYYTQKDYTNAVACCSKSISLDNTKPYPYYLIGYCYYDCELYADAINYFNQALSVDPNYTNAIKARKSAKTILVLTVVSQALTAVSNSLNNAYNSSANYGSTSNYSTYSNSSSPVKASGSMQRETCSFCHGTGKNPAKEYVAQFGLDPVQKDTRCDICGGWDNHYHKRCPSCNGKGYILKYKANSN